MTALYIIAAIALFLLLLLLIPAQLTVRYDGTRLSVKLSVLFLPFSLYPKKRRVREKDFSKKAIQKKKRRLTKKEIKKARKASRKPPTHPKRKRDVLGTVKLLVHILKGTHPKLIRAFRIRVCELHAVVATEDAAKTAILYGAVSQATAILLELCERFLWCNRSKKRVKVVPDFCGTKSSLHVRIRFTSNLFRLLRLAIASGILFLKHKLQNKNNVQTKGEQENG